MSSTMISSLFFFNDTATTEIYTLSLHDALPISQDRVALAAGVPVLAAADPDGAGESVAEAGEEFFGRLGRSEEHTSELQSHLNLVCRLLLEKKNVGNCTDGDVEDGVA